ncbi:MAG TPA: hypothetical protein VIC57_06350 [Candidatus Dormibacteraeota bacterium]|jgi:hypothetical protein
MLSAIAEFGRFWYGFIVGDDWTIAATIVAAVAVSYLLLRAGLPVWWLLPVAVIAILGISLRRARTTS